jgi:uncharacterized metal-binding protein
MENDFKVAVMVCSGIGRLVSTVVRQAAYMLKQDRPDSVVLISSGSLTGDVPEALEAARKYPLIVIDGCRPKCASALAAGKGVEPAAAIWVADVVARHKLSLAGENRKALGEKGMALARKIADEALEQIDLLVAEDMVSTL